MLSLTDRTIDLVEKRVDCVLRVGKPHDSGMIARPIGDLSQMFYKRSGK